MAKYFRDCSELLEKFQILRLPTQIDAFCRDWGVAVAAGALLGDR